MELWEMIVAEHVHEAKPKFRRRKQKVPFGVKTTLGVGRVNIVESSGEGDDDTYFTPREAQCMILLLQGKTVVSVAHALDLSPRTIESYLINMRQKLGCANKRELIEKIKTTDFMKHVNIG